MTDLIGTENINNVEGLDGTGQPAATYFKKSTAAFAGAGGSFSSAEVDTTTTTLLNIPGLTATLKSGTYRFHCGLPGTAGALGGVKYAFSYSGMTLTSIDVTGKAFTTAAVAVQHTTTTASGTSLLSSTSAAIYSEIDGVVVISGTGIAPTGATLQLQFAQSAASATTSSVYANASMQFVKIGV